MSLTEQDCLLLQYSNCPQKSTATKQQDTLYPHDPDARISVKPGKARKPDCHCSMAVDTAEGVISHIQADFADGRDSQYLTNISWQVQNRLKKNELIMTDFLADAGYSNGANYDFLEQRKVTGWIPVFGKYKPEIEGFPYYGLAIFNWT